jgi:hypothetical protein
VGGNPAGPYLHHPALSGDNMDAIVCTCREYLEDMANNWTCPVHGRQVFYSEDSKLSALFALYDAEICEAYDPVVERINSLTKEIGRQG